MAKRLRVAVVYGGRSGEHEVSLRSAAAVIANLDPERYAVVPVAIGKEGSWRTGPESTASLARRVEAELGFPCFVKPANLGSSVGISKVKQPGGLAAAVAEAGAYDPKLVIEAAIDGREFEVAVLGNDEPEASVVGELVPSREFY